MGLGIATGSGSYSEIVKFDARAGRLFRVDRDGSGTKQQTDITNDKPKFLVDFGSIETGWMHFPPASAPSFVVAPLGSALPQQPTPDHKQGFRMKIFAPNTLGGVREWATNSKCVIGAVDELHTRFEAAPEAYEGKIPVVQLSGSKAVQTKGPQGSTTNYAPVFDIVGWQPRPDALGPRTVPAPGKQIAATASAPQTAPVPTPVPATTAQLVDDEIPF